MKEKNDRKKEAMKKAEKIANNINKSNDSTVTESTIKSGGSSSVNSDVYVMSESSLAFDPLGYHRALTHDNSPLKTSRNKSKSKSEPKTKKSKDHKSRR